ncbi:MAG: ABC transporter permease, partial [Planctomycetaceae bacterium]|nr:ABC transporter permease [Planctomycetaceae bacterium]
TDQRPEPLLIVPISWLQQKLGVGDKINTVFFLTQTPEQVSTEKQRKLLEKLLKPSLDDLGIIVVEKKERYYIKSSRMLFTNPQAEAIQKTLPDAKPGLLYLAISIRATKNSRETPYSTIYATDINDHEIVLNRWTADDLGVEIGDEIELTWFEPDNVNVTKSKNFKLTGILPMDDLGADPDLVPEVQGFTDEASIADWDPPFPFDAKKIRKKDEDYWDKYRAAPKAFVSLKTGQELFGSRFGNTTTFLAESGTEKAENWERKLVPSVFGLNFIPVKEQGLMASNGTTPFSVLFLSFSFFIIASALMLVMMLFRLSVERRAKQIGIRLAVGWTPFFVAKILIAEGIVLAVFGSFFGTFFGIVYARLMVYGLTTWWLDAVTVPFLNLYINPLSLVIGFAGGTVLSVLTTTITLRKICSVPVKTLLGGVIQKTVNVTHFRTRRGFFSSRPFLLILIVLIVLIEILLPVLTMTGFFVHYYNPVLRSGIFFGSGVLVLILGLLQIYSYRGVGREGSSIHSLFGFAASNVTRYSGRSTLCIGLIASTCFLILSISVFRMDGSEFSERQQIVETQFPVYDDLNTVEGRDNLATQKDDLKLFEQNQILVQSLRVRDGDNAGCLNLYQPQNPRILGVSENTPISQHWSRLEEPITVDADHLRRVPVILDTNTAMYSLHLYGGVGDFYEMDDGQGGKIRCEIAGLLTNSVFQGDILMSEQNLLTLFPDVAGYRYFIVDTNMPFDKIESDLVPVLYRTLGDYGVTVESAAHRLQRFFAVQNTYLTTFQSLGGVGLLLGLFGLAVVQSRNVFERRKELALLNAVGFRKSRIVLFLLYESFFILFCGVFLAILASFFSLLPQLILTRWAANPQSIIVQFAWLLGGMVLIGVLSNVIASLAVLNIPVARELAEER